MGLTLGNSAGIGIPPALRGFLLGTRTIISATGSTDFVPNKYAKMLFVQMWGAGGGGKNCANSSAAQIVLGGGGGGGGYCEFVYPALPQGITFSVGTGGSGASGAAGGTTTASPKKGSIMPTGSIGSTIGSASPGAAGQSISTGTSQTFTSPSNLATGSSVTGFTLFTDIGGVAYRNSGTVAKSGKGSDPAMLAGGGGLAVIAHGAGNAATNFGAGGGGAMSVNAAGATAGGDGGNGLVIVWEYY